MKAKSFGFFITRGRRPRGGGRDARASPDETPRRGGVWGGSLPCPRPECWVYCTPALSGLAPGARRCTAGGRDERDTEDPPGHRRTGAGPRFRL